ncbi:MAG: transglycosylase domain-containing protein [Candidatus Pacebacteria bacterium]|nr:transglycosylase domain-containing protein [Candidatus Paceibacterota bacterium]
MKRTKNPYSLYEVLGLTVAIGFVCSGIFILWAATLEIPDLESFEQRKVAQSTKIYDRTGEVLLYDLHEDVRRTIIPFEDISRNIKNATVAIEDTEFYDHSGIRPLATLRAVFIQPLRGKGVQGGSTITQQVVKNSLLTSERRISRKLKEWVLAVKIEKTLNKEEILGIYLNESPYGGNLYGVEEASQAFFGKSAADVSIAEAAYVAALPQAPTYYSPYGNNRDKLEDRKNLVLAKMLENNFISSLEYESAKEEVVDFKPRTDTGIKAPHFVFYIQERLEEKYGKRAVDERGFKVITTLNYELQEKAEEIVERYALENVEKFNAENASLVAVDPGTGQILTMVGSRNYFDEEIDGNFNVTLAKRQPGSAFKPFIYATAFKKGYTPETVVFDLKTQFASSCEPDFLETEGECYSPGNYDNVFRGPVTLRNALAQSINIPAIKALYLAGLTDSLNTARDLGITTLTDVNRYGLTLVLGGGEVTLLEITGAYSVFANDGMKNSITGVLRIEDGDGNIVESFVSRPAQVLEPQVAREVSDILSDNNARAPAFGERSYLYFENHTVASKTGTTNDYRDAWIVGYTPMIAVGAWAGNNNNSPMEKKVAGFIIAPLWNEFMREALKTQPQKDFKKPILEYGEEVKPVLKGEWQGSEQYIVDTVSGKLATEFTPSETRAARVLTNVHSILYWVEKNNPNGPLPTTPQKDPQFNLWEYPIRKWVEEKNIIEGGEKPTEVDTIHTPQNQPHTTFTSINPTVAYSVTDQILVEVSYTSVFPIQKVDYFLNGAFIGSSSQSPFSLTFSPHTIQNIQRENTLKAVVYDSVFNKNSVETDLLLSF